MPVLLTVAKTLNGAAAADTLAGGDDGIDLGNVVSGLYTPITSQVANTGWQPLYIRHDAAFDPIFNVKTFTSPYSNTYGGTQNAADDFDTLKDKGALSGYVANNAGGLGAGLRIEQDADLGATLGLSAFDGTRAQVKIYGHDYGLGQLGIDIDTAFDLHVDALIYNNAGVPVDATTPVTGKIGKTGDTVLGDRALVKLRFYLETTAPDGGILQWDWVIAYSFTA